MSGRDAVGSVPLPHCSKSATEPSAVESSLTSVCLDNYSASDEINLKSGIRYCEDSFKSHEALCDITEQTLSKLLSEDQFLNDIAYDITLEEVLSQVNFIILMLCSLLFCCIHIRFNDLNLFIMLIINGFCL